MGMVEVGKWGRPRRWRLENGDGGGWKMGMAETMEVGKWGRQRLENGDGGDSLPRPALAASSFTNADFKTGRPASFIRFHIYYLSFTHL